MIGGTAMIAQRFKMVSAVHLFLIQSDKILLLRRFQTGYEDGMYSVVAGHLEGNEEIVAAMAREAQEEVSIHIQPEHLKIVGVMHRKEMDERIDFFLVADTWEGEIVNAEPAKCDDVAWFDLDKLPSNTVPYVRRAIENYREGVWFDSVGWDGHVSR
jgi:8-oxo-dGTP diphosphatase